MIEHYRSEVKVSIIIVNYNVKFYLEQCLLSVLASDLSFDVEIIVVDNNSTDGSKEYFATKFPSVTFIWNVANVGFAKANNQAIRISKGEYILLLNPDTVVGEHVISNVITFMDNTSDAGAVGVKMVSGNGTFLKESKRGFPSPWVSFCKIFGLVKLFPKSQLFGKYHLLFLDENETHQVDILCGAFMMVRKDVLDKVGLLDETFFMYGEDIDLSYRILLGGYHNYYLPEKIIHYKGESTRKDTMHYVKIFYHAMYIFFKKHYPRSGSIYSVVVPLGIFTRAFVAGAKRLLMPITKNFGKAKSTKDQFFDLSVTTYEDVIELIDSQFDKKNNAHIYNPNSGMVVSSSFCYLKKRDDVA